MKVTVHKDSCSDTILYKAEVIELIKALNDLFGRGNIDKFPDYVDSKNMLADYATEKQPGKWFYQYPDDLIFFDSHEQMVLAKLMLE